MKKIFISAFAIITCLTVFAQEPACPAISVSTSGYEAKEGDPLTMTANVNTNESITFNWSISGGSISSGQGTSSITIDSKGMAGQSITATLEVGGLPRTCSNSSSATVSITTAPKAAPAKTKMKTKAKKPSVSKKA